MEYIAQKGIVMTSVGDQKILVSAASLHDRIPYVSTINETASFCWNLLVDGISEEELLQRVIEEFEVENPDVVKSDIAMLVKQLYEQGYITRKK